MFNLDQAITNWRRQMIAGGIKTPVPLEELESHLREDVDRRMRSGTPAQQAFEEAVQQVGSADELKLEFGKIQPQRPAVSPRLINRGCIAMAVFIVFWGVWLLFDAPIERVHPLTQLAISPSRIHVIRNLSRPLELRPIAQTTCAGKVLGFAWLMLVGGYVTVLPRLNRNIWSGVRGWALRRAIAVACSFFFVAWVAALSLDAANIIHLSLGVAILPNLILWPLSVAAIATALVMDHATDWKALGLWSPTAKQSFEMAEVEALNLHHNFVGTEHLLLGLLETRNSPVPGVLAKMGVSGETVRAEIEKFFNCLPGESKSLPIQAPRCTPRAKKAMAIALREANALHRNSAETEHILLGLILEGGGVAARVLKNLGVDADNARKELLRISG